MWHFFHTILWGRGAADLHSGYSGQWKKYAEELLNPTHTYSGQEEGLRDLEVYCHITGTETTPQLP